jgi:GT2 family glycosyltransferase
MLHPTDILAVLVTYRTAFADSSSWQSLRSTPEGQQLQWLVYDNSPDPDPMAAAAGIHYEHHPENPGVGAAYQAGARLAMDLGCQWLLLLDQDSRFPADWWSAYARGHASHPAATLLSPQMQSGTLLISPARLRFERAWPAKTAPLGTYALTAHAPINAGILVNTNAYLASGGHDARAALDFSDFIFIHRFQRVSPTAVCLPLVVQHGLSGLEKSSLAQALQRFHHYCRGASYYAAQKGSRRWLRIWCLWRAALLSSRYRNVKFFSVFSREF